MSESIVQGPVANEQAERERRATMHRVWGSVAGAWAEHAQYVDHRGAAVTARMLDLARLQPADRVLELACGPGGLGLAAARALGPEGRAVLSDVAPEMVAVAAERAQEAGLGNVTTAVLDLEHIEQPGGAYDVVLCREGLMFAIDPERAAREIARVLRPGGRAVIAVWGPREDNPWLGVVFDAVSGELGVPVPPAGVPGPFALADRERLTAILRTAGFDPVEIEECPSPVRTGSFEEWWRRTTALAGPLAGMLAGLPADKGEAITERARAAVQEHRTGETLELPALTLIASAGRV